MSELQNRFTIREATVDDVPAVASMVDELLSEIMQAIGVQVFDVASEETASRLLNFIETGRYAVFVAIDSGGGPVGFIALYVSCALYAGGVFGTIPEPCVLVAYSMGGRIGLALALRFPELFSKAVIVSSSPGLRTEAERAARRKSDEGVARKIERNFEGFIEFWYDQPLFSTLKSHALFREVEALRKQGSPENLARALHLLGTGNQPSLWDELPGNRLPMLFCVGEKDAKYVEIGHQMAAVCPKSRVELFEGCGHTLHIEEPERFLWNVERFIAQ
jgi:2-succinyl-6-hydroxy-2,4-cyclohexadiene-1-carboxylate synthase